MGVELTEIRKIYIFLKIFLKMTVEEQKRQFQDLQSKAQMDDDEDSEEEEDEEDEEEMIDPLDTVRARCAESGDTKKWKDELAICTKRVESRENTEETCTEELFHFLHHRDECVAGQFKSIVKANW